jgi:hypothetical protein
VLDADGSQPIAGYARAQGQPVILDSIDAVARWKDKADLTALAGRTVRLRFHLWNAELYAFWFGA